MKIAIMELEIHYIFNIGKDYIRGIVDYWIEDGEIVWVISLTYWPRRFSPFWYFLLNLVPRKRHRGGIVGHNLFLEVLIIQAQFQGVNRL